MNFQQRAKEVIDVEIAGMEKVRDQINGDFSTAIDWILATVKNGGKVVVTGVGKNFHIGQKMVATFNSTGTPSALLHPIEAMHGDFGLVGEKDVVLALSYSGGSDELIALLPALKRRGLKIIGMTGDATSPLGIQSDLILPITVDKEACPFGMAPTTSPRGNCMYSNSRPAGQSSGGLWPPLAMVISPVSVSSRAHSPVKNMEASLSG